MKNVTFEPGSHHVIIFVVKFPTDPNNFNPLFDVKEFRSPQFQRVYQYLKLSEEGANLDNFTFVPGHIDGDHKTCLTLLLRFGKCSRFSFQYTL